MAPNKRYDFLQNDELSSGSTYALGLSGSLNFHNRNLFKGANLLTLSVNGGLEYQYTEDQGKTFISHFNVLTQYLGANASIDFPKFIAPFSLDNETTLNAPHTVISGGTNLADRVNYFRLINTSFNYSYNWRRTRKTTWSFSPVFFNIIRMPYQTELFNTYLEQFPFLKNTYKPNFIEGESLTFSYTDQEQKHNRNYSTVRLGLEEAGGVMGVLNQLGVALNDLYSIKFAQYTRLDFDLRHFVTFNHSEIALRFSGGIGVPYGQSSTLPYIKQYFSGGPYSLRGWQIRTLGPGSYFDANTGTNTVIDRTGDIKLEFTGEYRFPIAPLFAGAIKMNGAVFTDAGNIWLARRDSTLPGGQFTFGTLGQSLAADAGAGLRFDIATFLTFRMDVAMPVKMPNVMTDGGWVWRKIDLPNATWRADNLVLNFAIGYPF
jgi:outer membrane protein assembly factor BamA